MKLHQLIDTLTHYQNFGAGPEAEVEVFDPDTGDLYDLMSFEETDIGIVYIRVMLKEDS